MVVYTWRPIFPLEDYEVIVHELAPGYAQKQFQKPTFPLHPGGITISVQEQQLGDRVSLFQNEWNEAPLCITHYDKTERLCALPIMTKLMPSLCGMVAGLAPICSLILIGIQVIKTGCELGGGFCPLPK